MAFLATAGSAVSYSEIMHAIWTHASNGSASVSIPTENGNVATWNGTSFATPSASTFWDASGSYMVLQIARPDAGVCQVKLTRTTTIARIFAPNGGWVSSDGGFGASLVSASAALFDTTPAVGDTIRCTSGNTDTYGAGPYAAAGLVVWWYDSSATDQALGFYFGNVVPKNPADQKAVVFLGRVVSAASSTGTWGLTTGPTNNFNLAFSDVGRTTLTYASMTSNSRCDTVASDHDGYYGAGELMVDVGASKWIGNLPPSLLRRISNTIADDSLIGGGQWRTGNGLAMRVATS